MDAEKYTRSVRLLCSTCGSSDFAYEDAAGPLRCNSCDRVFTRDELIAENGAIIENELDEMKAQVVGDFGKEMREMLRKSFSGSKHITFK